MIDVSKHETTKRSYKNSYRKPSYTVANICTSSLNKLKVKDGNFAEENWLEKPVY